MQWQKKVNKYQLLKGCWELTNYTAIKFMGFPTGAY